MLQLVGLAFALSAGTPGAVLKPDVQPSEIKAAAKAKAEKVGMAFDSKIEETTLKKMGAAAAAPAFAAKAPPVGVAAPAAASAPVQLNGGGAPAEEGPAIVTGNSVVKPAGVMLLPEDQNPLAVAEAENAKSATIPGAELLVVSYGGVGTTAFLNELKNNFNSIQMSDAEDGDGLQHLPWQRLVNEKFTQIKNVSKILYLYSDPKHAATSHYRRGWAWSMAAKTRKERMKSKGEAESLWEHFPHTLEEFALAGEDVFEFEAHFDSYKKECAETWPGQVAFLDITRAKDYIEELAEFLNVSPVRLASKLSSYDEINSAELLAERESFLFTRPAAMNTNKTLAVEAAARFDLHKMLNRDPTREEFDAAMMRYKELNHPGMAVSPAASQAVSPKEFFKLTKNVQAELKAGKDSTVLAAEKTAKKYADTVALAVKVAADKKVVAAAKEKAAAASPEADGAAKVTVSTAESKSELDTTARILGYLENKYASLQIKLSNVGVNGFNNTLSTPGWERGRSWKGRTPEEQEEFDAAKTARQSAAALLSAAAKLAGSSAKIVGGKLNATASNIAAGARR